MDSASTSKSLVGTMLHARIQERTGRDIGPSVRGTNSTQELMFPISLRSALIRSKHFRASFHPRRDRKTDLATPSTVLGLQARANLQTRRPDRDWLSGPDTSVRFSAIREDLSDRRRTHSCWQPAQGAFTGCGGIDDGDGLAKHSFETHVAKDSSSNSRPHIRDNQVTLWWRKLDPNVFSPAR